MGHAGDRGGGQLRELVQGQVQVFGKVVGGAHGDVSDDWGLREPGGAGDGFAEGTVPSGHHDLVKCAAPADNGIPRVSPVLGWGRR